MASAVYSTRFLHIATDNAWFGYTCPAGKVLVVRSITFSNSGGAATDAVVELAGVTLLHAVLQANAPSISIDMRHVGYAGELLRGVTGLGGALWVSGYLLGAPAASAGDDPPLESACDPPAWWIAAEELPAMPWESARTS